VSPYVQSSHEPPFSLIGETQGLYLFPHHPASYILLLASGKAFSNLPEHTWEDYNKMAPALPPLVQTLSPIPCVPQARPASQAQIPQPQPLQQLQPQLQPQPQPHIQPPPANGWTPAGQPAGTYFRGHLIQRAGAGPVPPLVTWPYIPVYAPYGATAPYGGTSISNANSLQVGGAASSDVPGVGYTTSDPSGGTLGTGADSGGGSGGGGSTSTSNS
jgi:hypothetical protein